MNSKVGFIKWKLSCIYPALLFLFLLSSRLTLAQSPDSLNQLISSTENYLKANNYEKAHLELRNIFNNYESFPNDVVYLYGQTMLGLKKYVPARDAFKNYLSSQGELKKYQEDALILLDSANKHICPLCENTLLKEVEVACGKCSGDGRIELKTKCVTCNGLGHIICTICGGKGVINQKGGMNDTFHSCANCQGKGYVICAKCKGHKVDSHMCDLCSGSGKVKTKVTCVH